MNTSILRPRATRSLVASAVLAALAISGPAGAASPDELGTIKLYGNVTIAQDSADKWGPWEQFEPPRAGSPTAAPIALRAGRELYRPLPTPPNGQPEPPPPPPVVTDLLCVAGSICGYGLQWSGKIYRDDEGSPAADPTTVHMITIDPVGERGEGSIVSDAITVQLDTLPGGSSMATPRLNASDGPEYFNDGEGGNYWAYVHLPYRDYVPGNANFAMEQDLDAYVEGGYYRWLETEGVVGRVTDAADMTAMRADGFKARYMGQDHSVATGQWGNVTIDVDFGSGTFAYSTSGGVQTYQAEGVVKGSGYVATKFTTADTSGMLQGSFIGRDAVGTVGAASVTQNGVKANTYHMTSREAPN